MNEKDEPMMDKPGDPRLEKLVASLYNELSEEDERALRLEMESDPELRAEWEELKSTRALFQTLEVEESAPSFLVVDKTSGSSARSGFRARLMEFQTWGGWAVAAAAVLFLLLGFGGFRVQKLENGFAFRFGPDKPPVERPRSNQAHLEETRPLAAHAPTGSVGNESGGMQIVSTNRNEAYMTQAEFDTRSSEVLKMVVTLLNDYRSRRDQELSTMMQAVYGQLNEQQASDYRELRGRIEAVGLGLRVEQTRTSSFIEDLLGHVGADSGTVTMPGLEDHK